ncbi:glycosyltransferase family 2 protein [Microbacterium sp. 179-B 1A2 NHS]|uniref:glycosyltransferase family 2 protein n=1 Tax=Microbacterium sp. 179-B 1A2 NHS TaxID=3142383 RepID=UPI0039A011CC
MTTPGRPRRLPAVPLPRRPFVSVVIPCYNYEDYVAGAVESALSQGGVDVEVIVVDDRSTDGSATVVGAIADQDDRVRLIRHTENRGAVDTFNHGLARVRGEYLVRLDADDLLTPGSLRRSTALAEAHPSVGLVYGHPLHFTGTELPRPRLRARTWTVWPGSTWLEDRCRTGVNVITSPEVLMRRSVVDEVGGQRDLAHTHDMEMWLRIACVSDVGYVAGADQAWHREHARSLSQSLDPRFGDLEDRRDAFATLFAWSADRVPATPALRILAARALADEALRAIVHMSDRGRSDADLVRRYRAFAEETDPGGRTLPHAAAASLALRRGSRRPAPWQTARAGLRRIDRDLQYARWHRTGVFTPGR